MAPGHPSAGSSSLPLPLLEFLVRKIEVIFVRVVCIIIAFVISAKVRKERDSRKWVRDRRRRTREEESEGEINFQFAAAAAEL